MTTITPRNSVAPDAADLLAPTSERSPGERRPPVERRHRTDRVIVVGYSGSEASRAALRWVASAFDEGCRVLVVHATGAPVSVRNGPSAEVAANLGQPVWATVRSVVDDLIGRERADTIVEHGRVVDVLARHGADADLVVLGAGRRRVFKGLVGAVPCVVVGISERDVRP